MATRKNTTTKALKAAQAGEAKKPAGCAVAEIVKQTKLIAALDKVAEEPKGADKSDTSHCDEIEAQIRDRLVHNRKVAGYLTPRSATGAAFMLLSMFSDVLNMRDSASAWYRRECFWRLEFAAYALRRFMANHHHVDFWHMTGDY